jgi:hypothetical protein
MKDEASGLFDSHRLAAISEKYDFNTGVHGRI